MSEIHEEIHEEQQNPKSSRNRLLTVSKILTTTILPTTVILVLLTTAILSYIELTRVCRILYPGIHPLHVILSAVAGVAPLIVTGIAAIALAITLGAAILLPVLKVVLHFANGRLQGLIIAGQIGTRLAGGMV